MAISLSTAQAENWTLNDGTFYANVKVIKVEGDGVTIIYEEGGLMLPLDKLPAYLQKRFNYDPDVAREAEKKRIAQEKASEKALEKEEVEADALKKNQEIADAQALALAHAQVAGLPAAKTNAAPVTKH